MRKILSIVLFLFSLTFTYSQSCEYTVTLPNANYIKFDNGNYQRTTQGSTYTLECGTIVYEVVWVFIIWDEQINVVDCDSCSLPVEFLISSYNCSEKILEWSTATETNNDYFTIKVGTDYDNGGLIPINSFIVNGSGNSNMVKDYKLKLNINDSYVEIWQTDYDGTTKLINTQYISCLVEKDISLSPNPVKYGYTKINGDFEMVQLYDLSGKEVHTHLINNKLVGLSSGFYIVIIDNHYKFKLVVE